MRAGVCVCVWVGGRGCVCVCVRVGRSQREQGHQDRDVLPERGGGGVLIDVARPGQELLGRAEPVLQCDRQHSCHHAFF